MSDIAEHYYTVREQLIAFIVLAIAGGIEGNWIAVATCVFSAMYVSFDLIDLL